MVQQVKVALLGGALRACEFLLAWATGALQLFSSPTSQLRCPKARGGLVRNTQNTATAPVGPQPINEFEFR